MNDHRTPFADMDDNEYPKRPVRRRRPKKTAPHLGNDSQVKEKKEVDLADLVTPVISNCESDRAATMRNAAVFRPRPAPPDVQVPESIKRNAKKRKAKVSDEKMEAQEAALRRHRTRTWLDQREKDRARGGGGGRGIGSAALADGSRRSLSSWTSSSEEPYSSNRGPSRSDRPKPVPANEARFEIYRDPLDVDVDEGLLTSSSRRVATEATEDDCAASFVVGKTLAATFRKFEIGNHSLPPKITRWEDQLSDSKPSPESRDDGTLLQSRGTRQTDISEEGRGASSLRSPLGPPEESREQHHPATNMMIHLAPPPERGDTLTVAFSDPTPSPERNESPKNQVTAFLRTRSSETREDRQTTTSPPLSFTPAEESVVPHPAARTAIQCASAARDEISTSASASPSFPSGTKGQVQADQTGDGNESSDRSSPSRQSLSTTLRSSGGSCEPKPSWINQAPEMGMNLATKAGLQKALWQGSKDDALDSNARAKMATNMSVLAITSSSHSPRNLDRAAASGGITRRQRSRRPRPPKRSTSVLEHLGEPTTQLKRPFSPRDLQRFRDAPPANPGLLELLKGKSKGKIGTTVSIKYDSPADDASDLTTASELDQGDDDTPPETLATTWQHHETHSTAPNAQPTRASLSRTYPDLRVAANGSTESSTDEAPGSSTDRIPLQKIVVKMPYVSHAVASHETSLPNEKRDEQQDDNSVNSSPKSNGRDLLTLPGVRRRSGTPQDTPLRLYHVVVTTRPDGPAVATAPDESGSSAKELGRQASGSAVVDSPRVEQVQDRQHDRLLHEPDIPPWRTQARLAQPPPLMLQLRIPLDATRFPTPPGWTAGTCEVRCFDHPVEGRLISHPALLDTLSVTAIPPLANTETIIQQSEHQSVNVDASLKTSAIWRSAACEISSSRSKNRPNNSQEPLRHAEEREPPRFHLSVMYETPKAPAGGHAEQNAPPRIHLSVSPVSNRDENAVDGTRKDCERHKPQVKQGQDSEFPCADDVVAENYRPSLQSAVQTPWANRDDTGDEEEKKILRSRSERTTSTSRSSSVDESTPSCDHDSPNLETSMLEGDSPDARHDDETPIQDISRSSLSHLEPRGGVSDSHDEATATRHDSIREKAEEKDGDFEGDTDSEKCHSTSRTITGPFSTPFCDGKSEEKPDEASPDAESVNATSPPTNDGSSASIVEYETHLGDEASLSVLDMKSIAKDRPISSQADHYYAGQDQDELAFPCGEDDEEEGEESSRSPVAAVAISRSGAVLGKENASPGAGRTYNSSSSSGHSPNIRLVTRRSYRNDASRHNTNERGHSGLDEEQSPIGYCAGSPMPICCLQFFWLVSLSCVRSNWTLPLSCVKPNFDSSDEASSKSEKNAAGEGSHGDHSPCAARHAYRDSTWGGRKPSRTDTNKVRKTVQRKAGRTLAKLDRNEIAVSQKPSKRRRRRITVIPRALRR